MLQQALIGIVPAVLSAASALGGVYLQSRINLEAQEKAIQAQNQRASADYFLEKEAEAFIDLLEAAEKCHAITFQYVNRAGQDKQSNDELRNDLNEALAEFESVARTKVIFLEEEDRKAVNQLLGTIQKSVHAGDMIQGGRREMGHELVDWEELVDDFDEFQTRMNQLARDRVQEIRN